MLSSKVHVNQPGWLSAVGRCQDSLTNRPSWLTYTRLMQLIFTCRLQQKVAEKIHGK